jgi:hypothetical protein
MSALPVYRCRRAPQPPSLDENVAGSVWETAERISSEFHLLGTDADRSDHFLEASALWDDEALYVRFVSDPAPVPVTKRERDEDLFNECAVELFLRAGSGYYEIEVNPLGAVLDLYFPDVKEQNWQAMAAFDVPGMTWAVQEIGDAGRWRTQLAIPWAGVPQTTWAEHDGQRCVFANFARSQKLPDGSFDLTTWDGAQGAFCELERMGRLVLVD